MVRELICLWLCLVVVASGDSELTCGATSILKSQHGICLGLTIWDGKVVMKSCIGYTSMYRVTWQYSEATGRIFNWATMTCLGVKDAYDGAGLEMKSCDSGDAKQQWLYDATTGQLKVKQPAVHFTETSKKRCHPMRNRVHITGATSLDACKEACASDQSCAAANFYPGNSKCYKCPSGFSFKWSGASSTWVKGQKTYQMCLTAAGWRDNDGQAMVSPCTEVSQSNDLQFQKQQWQLNQDVMSGAADRQCWCPEDTADKYLENRGVPAVQNTCGPGEYGDPYLNGIGGYEVRRCCNVHDVCYAERHSKSYCDEEFRLCIQVSAPHLADIFFQGVDWLGNSAFDETQRAHYRCSSTPKGSTVKVISPVQSPQGPLKSDGKCLDWTSSGGHNVYMSQCSDTQTHQEWYWSGEALRSKLAADKWLCLDFGTGNRGNAEMKDCDGSDNQKWYFDGTVIKSRGSTSRCLDWTGRLGRNAYILGCHGGSHQIWTSSAHWSINILTLKSEGKCLDWTSASGHNVYVKSCSSNLNHQDWYWSGEALISVGSPTLCLAWTSTISTSGNRHDVNMKDCDSNDRNQMWYFTGSVMQSRGSPSLCLDWTGHSGHDAYMKECHGGSHQTWSILHQSV